MNKCIHCVCIRFAPIHTRLSPKIRGNFLKVFIFSCTHINESYFIFLQIASYFCTLSPSLNELLHSFMKETFQSRVQATSDRFCWSLHLDKRVFRATLLPIGNGTKRWKPLRRSTRLYDGWSASSEPRFWRQRVVLLAVWDQAFHETKSRSLKIYLVFWTRFFTSKTRVAHSSSHLLLSHLRYWNEHCLSALILSLLFVVECLPIHS